MVNQDFSSILVQTFPGSKITYSGSQISILSFLRRSEKKIDIHCEVKESYILYSPKFSKKHSYSILYESCIFRTKKLLVS